MKRVERPSGLTIAELQVMQHNFVAPWGCARFEKASDLKDAEPGNWRTTGILGSMAIDNEIVMRLNGRSFNSDLAPWTVLGALRGLEVDVEFPRDPEAADGFRLHGVEAPLTHWNTREGLLRATVHDVDEENRRLVVNPVDGSAYGRHTHIYYDSEEFPPQGLNASGALMPVEQDDFIAQRVECPYDFTPANFVPQQRPNYDPSPLLILRREM